MMSIEEMILEILSEWAMEGLMDGVWREYSGLADEIEQRWHIKYPIRHLKSAMKILRSEGKVSLETCYNEDGFLHGKGFFIREKI